jgi:hypothetical protein
VVLWNAIIAATMLVTNSTRPMSTTVWPRCVPARLKMSSGPSARATSTIRSGPVATVIAHADTV